MRRISFIVVGTDDDDDDDTTMGALGDNDEYEAALNGLDCASAFLLRPVLDAAVCGCIATR